MPNLQALAAVPSFGSQLGQALGGGISQGIGVALQQMLEQKSQQRKTEQLLSTLGLSGSIQPDVDSESRSQTSSPKLDLTPEKILAASIENPQLGTMLSNLYKNQQQRSEQEEGKKIAQESLDRMSDLLKSGNLGFGSKLKSKAFGGQTAEDVGEFESLSGALEALLVDKVSRGTLSNARFKYITETLLPKPNDRQATIQGKLKALSKELGLKLPKSIKSESKGETTFSSLPSAQEYSGRKIKDTSSGRIFKSDGQKWSEVK